MAAGGRNPDHRLARPGQHPRRRHDGGGLAVEDHDPVRFSVATEMVQRQLVQAFAHQRRRQFVVERRQAVVRGLEAPFQAAEVVDSVKARVRHPRLDESPGMAQFGVVVAAVADEFAVSVGQARRMGVAEAVFIHGFAPGIFKGSSVNPCHLTRLGKTVNGGVVRHFRFWHS